VHILQVNSTDVGGGAEQVALTLHREYARRGHRSSLVVGSARTGEEGIVELDDDALRGTWARSWREVARALAPLDRRVPGAGPLRRSLPLVVGRPRNWWATRRGHEDFDHPATSQLLAIAGSSPDVIHAHNLHWGRRGYFDLRALESLSSERPFFLTLHDAWLLSGHCAHSFDCERWLTGCGKCPDLSIYPSIARDATAFNWRRKRDIYARTRLRVATPSRWLMDKVERSILAAGIAEARVIPYGIDLRNFHSADKTLARHELGLPTDRPIVMFAATGLRSNPFKDVPLLRAAIATASDEPLLFLAVGEDGPQEHHGQAVIRFVPPQEHRTMARFYQAADVYVHAARADTFPLVILEAMACGTPIVATAVGGIPEQVIDGETGRLVPAGEVRAFAEALRGLLTDDARRRAMGAAAAADAAQRFALSRMVDAYLEWYAEVAADDRPSREAVA
jgi:glycosyltransferase involved in cell wall biosynthesis